MQLEVTAAASRERLLLRTGHASTKKNDACVPLGTTGPRVGSWSSPSVVLSSIICHHHLWNLQLSLYALETWLPASSVKRGKNVPAPSPPQALMKHRFFFFKENEL